MTAADFERLEKKRRVRSLENALNVIPEWGTEPGEGYSFGLPAWTDDAWTVNEYLQLKKRGLTEDDAF